MNRTLFRKTIAALLSISFLWIFAACILLCNDSVCLEESLNAAVVFVNHNEQTLDTCPIAESAKATMTERTAFDFFTFTIISWRQIFNFKPKVNLVNIDLSRKVFVFASPPLERIPVLRI